MDARYLQLTGAWLKVSATKTSAEVLRIGGPTPDGKVPVIWGRSEAVMMQLKPLSSGVLGVDVDWEKFGHPEWNVRCKLRAQAGHEVAAAEFLLREADGVLIEKGCQVWQRLPEFLTHEQLESFRKTGFLVLRRAVPPDLVKRAQRAILADLRDTYRPEDLDMMSAQSFCRELQRDDGGVLSDLMQCSILMRAVESLVGPAPWGKGHMPQVAVRFPEDPRFDGLPGTTTWPHIDGVPTASNGVGQFSPFTALVGVALSDQLEDFEGNLVVYPGSHQQGCSSFQRQREASGTLWPSGNAALVPEGGIDGIAPLQLHLHAGDAVIAHYLLAHCVAEHRGSDIRINAYWRFTHQAHKRDLDQGRQDFVCDLWSGFDAVW